MIQLTLGSKGEVVIPKKIRDYMGLSKNKKIILELKEKTILLHPIKTDIVKQCEERAKKYNLDPKKITYGDKLYEETFQ